MSLKRRGGRQGEDLERRVGELEATLGALSRAHEAEIARLDERIDVLWAIAVPPWIREALPHARETGWIVDATPKAVVFRHFERDDQYTIPLPLTCDEQALAHQQQQLHLRLGFAGPGARPT